MRIHKSEPLSDVTYWLAQEIAKTELVIDLNKLNKSSIELDIMYQLLSSKVQRYWWQNNSIQLTPTVIRNAFFQALSMLRERNIEFERLRGTDETAWVKSLLGRD